ncbi:MAG: hypothetical protein ABSB49_19425 [Polyangia bacterium]
MKLAAADKRGNLMSKVKGAFPVLLVATLGLACGNSGLRVQDAGNGGQSGLTASGGWPSQAGSGGAGTGGVTGGGGSGGRPDGSDSAVDAGAGSACSSPSVGAACTPDETPCATCCTDHWTCTGGVWENQFLGCLPAGFLCGDQSCNEGVSYCDIIPGVEGGELPHPSVYTCKTLPSPCYGRRCPTCDCLTQAGIAFSSCSADAGGGIFVTQ